MYFLRRRHGRKPQSDQSRDQRRDKPPGAVNTQAPPATMTNAEPVYAELEQTQAPRPVVITKARRARTALPQPEDTPPAGTFRAGTLHIARANETGASPGKI